MLTRTTKFSVCLLLLGLFSCGPEGPEGTTSDEASVGSETTTGGPSTESGTQPNTSTDTGMCATQMFSTCTLPADCSKYKCGECWILFDKNGCVRAPCASNSDCGSHESCTLIGTGEELFCEDLFGWCECRANPINEQIWVCVENDCK